MYQTETSLEPLLGPEAYHSAAAFDLEQQAVFANSWHLIGVASQINSSGDFLSATIMGVPIVIRNFDGELVALRNVCAHRQCSLVSKNHGHSEQLKCPYHGWEYGSDGLTRKIPGATNFPKFDRARYRLDRFPLEKCGDLLFVRLTEEGLSLRDFIGDLFEKFEAWFSAPQYALCMNRSLDYPANWKIPVEGSLESYHIPEVHPKSFSEDPGEERSDHFFTPRSSSFHTRLMTPKLVDKWLRIWERLVLKFMGIEYHEQYEHHHVFPNLMISHTASLSLANFVVPVSPTSSVGQVWQFGRQPDRAGVLRKCVAWGLGKLASGIGLQILGEDLAIFPAAQVGAVGANRPGILGRCEERLHSFQQFVAGRIDAYKKSKPDTPGNTCAHAVCDDAAIGAEGTAQ